MIKKENYNDLYAFVQVATVCSFSQAARQLGVSPPALSKTIRQLEQRLGVQLLQRTTRNVSLTRAGEQLFIHAKSSFDKLNHELAWLEHYRSTPKGLVRISASLLAIDTLLLPKLASFEQQYPNIHVELNSDNRLIDIVASGFDAGVRLGADIEDGMIAVQIAKGLQMALVAHPNYLAKHGIVQSVADLAQHRCISYVLSDGKEYPWCFEYQGKAVKFYPQGQWRFNDYYPIKTAVNLALGVAYLPKPMVANELATGQLIQLLGDDGQHLSALYLYYPHRNVSPALRVLIDYLKCGE